LTTEGEIGAILKKCHNINTSIRKINSLFNGYLSEEVSFIISAIANYLIKSKKECELMLQELDNESSDVHKYRSIFKELMILSEGKWINEFQPGKFDDVLYSIISKITSHLWKVDFDVSRLNLNLEEDNTKQFKSLNFILTSLGCLDLKELKGLNNNSLNKIVEHIESIIEKIEKKVNLILDDINSYVKEFSKESKEIIKVDLSFIAHTISFLDNVKETQYQKFKNFDQIYRDYDKFFKNDILDLTKTNFLNFIEKEIMKKSQFDITFSIYDHMGY